MEDRHKNILRVNRSKIIDNIEDIKKIVDMLFQDGVITSGMKEGILEGHKTGTDQKRALLDLMPRRGDTAFDQFYQVLVQCDEGTAADLLRPDLAEQRKFERKQRFSAAKHDYPPPITIPAQSVNQPIASPEVVLPEDWPDETFDPLSINVTLCDQAGPMYDKFERSNDPKSHIYRMRRKVRGKLLMVNNEDFSGARKEANLSLEDREGTDMDATSLSLLFQNMHFKIIPKRNLTAEDIFQVLQKESRTDHSNFDCFVCFILSHGTGGGVYGTDGKVVYISDIQTQFDGENCPSLSGKPKLFFIQACQGTKIDPGAPTAVSDMTKSDSDVDLQKVIKDLKQFRIQQETRSDADKETTVPTKADTFLALATTPDYISWRNTKKGTWFVQAITYVVQKFAAKDNINSLMTKVNSLVSRGITLTGMRQISMTENTFRKEFYFFPGLYEAEHSQESQPQESSLQSGKMNQVHPTD